MNRRMMNLAMPAMMAALIALCSWICIPAPVPFTLQTLGVFCAAGLLDNRESFRAVLVYLLLGVVGLPVFSGFSGGFGHLLGPSGGFLLSFLLVPVICSAFGKSSKAGILAFSVSLLCCYVCGCLWYAAFYLKSLSLTAIASAFAQCVLPFVIPDVLKMICAVRIIESVKKSPVFRRNCVAIKDLQ